MTISTFVQLKVVFVRNIDNFTSISKTITPYSVIIYTHTTWGKRRDRTLVKDRNSQTRRNCLMNLTY